MSRRWRTLDLEGGGLQSANLKLARLLKRRSAAYAAWLLFPVGGHAWYLRDRRRALVYLAVSAIALTAYALLPPLTALAPAAALMALALFDLYWIDKRLVQLNKALRMAVYLGQGAAAPPGFAGRYTDDASLADYLKEKEQERGGHQPAAVGRPQGSRRRAPSFAEQEAMLREIARRARDKD